MWHEQEAEEGEAHMTSLKALSTTSHFPLLHVLGDWVELSRKE